MKKKLLILLFLMIIIIGGYYFYSNTNEAYGYTDEMANSSYSSEQFTKSELQDMIVSTGMSYFFNRDYTDYEQWGIDKASTYEWRKYTNSPEMVSKSNYFNITCSTFTGIVDLYSIGYDLSPYYKYSNMSYRNYDNSGKLTEYHSKDSTSNFQTAYLDYGKGVNASNTGMLFTKIFNAYDLIPECVNNSCNNIQYDIKDNHAKVVDGKTINQYAKDLVYYYETKLNDSNAINAARTSLINGTTKMSFNASSVDYTESEEEQATIKNTVINLLEPGDNLIYMRLNGSTISAHSMLYVGNIFGDEHGFLHSAGTDFNYRTDDSDGFVGEPYSFGEDERGIWYDTWESQKERNKISDFIFRSDNQKTYAFFIIRPVNRYCSTQNNQEKCYIGHGNDDESKNTIISEKFKKNSNTYVNNSVFRNKLKYLKTEQYQYFIHENESIIYEYINKYNSVNVNDIITYRLELINNSNLYNQNIEYGSTDGTITITAKVPDGTEYVSCIEGPAESCSYKDGYVEWKNVVTHDATAAKELKRITYKVRVKSNKSIKNEGMRINYSYQCSDSASTCNSYLQLGSMETAVNYTINDNTNIQKFQNAVDNRINENKNYSDNNGFTFISDIYINEFDIDLGSNFTNDNIRETVFKALPSNVEEEILNVNNNIQITNNTAFIKKTLINNEQKNINKMLIPGAYGGRKLNYNVEGNRATILFKKNIRGTLEIGDVLITWDFANDTNSNQVYSYLFYGYNNNNYPIFVQYRDGNYTKYGDGDSSGYQLLKKIYAYDLFAILRPTRVYGTGTITFNSNYSSNEIKEQDILLNDNIQLQKNTFTRDGYRFANWNTKADGTGTSYNDEQTTSFSKNQILYAIWEKANAYTINNYTVDETNNYISKIKVNSEVSTFKANIILENGYGISVDTKTVNNKQVLYTGGKTRITHGQDLYQEYTNVVIGDINGDGAINSADLLKIRQHLLGIKILNGAYFLSSDINYDNTINSADLLRERQHLLGTKPIN